MIIKWPIQKTAVILFCLFAFSGCGDMQEAEERQRLAAKIQKTSLEKRRCHEVFEREDRIMYDSIAETLCKIPKEKKGLMEVSANRDVIAISEGTMIARAEPQEILMGNPILYDRFRIDGWVFEWLISDYNDYDDDNWLMEDGVLVVSHEGDTEDIQIIHVTAEGSYGQWVAVKNKFEYVDVNFDGIQDLLICTGYHGNQGLVTYYCFLQTEGGFVEASAFTDIANPAVDAENQLIRSQWRNSAVSHSWAEYKWQNDTYVRYRELCEDLELSDDGEVWVWSVNGEEVARSDELSTEEITEFLYGESSEWKLMDDRWRTLFNNGLTADYSIYEEK